MVQDSKVIVKKVTGAQAQAMTTTPSTYIELIPAPGANKVLVIREIEIFIDRGTWKPTSDGNAGVPTQGWQDDLQVAIKTPWGGNVNFRYNTFSTFQKKYLNHSINNVFTNNNAVDVIIVRDAPTTQVRAYPNVPLLLKPKTAATYTVLNNNSKVVDDDYYFRITYKIMDMTTDFAVTTT
jgi:hypothetical protein